MKGQIMNRRNLLQAAGLGLVTTASRNLRLRKPKDQSRSALSSR
jgi:hypothetical protein